MTDHADIVREDGKCIDCGKIVLLPEHLARAEAAEAELDEALLSLSTYKAALSGTQHVRDDYKDRAEVAEKERDSLIASVPAAHRAVVAERRAQTAEAELASVLRTNARITVDCANRMKEYEDRIDAAEAAAKQWRLDIDSELVSLRAEVARLIAERDERQAQSAADRVVEHREGMMEVYDWHGRYSGCIGSETWDRLIAGGAEA